MKQKILLSWALALLLMFASVCAYAADNLEEVAGGICAYAQGDLDLQGWIDGPLCQDAGSASDNYILALCRQGTSADYRNYVQTASDQLESDAISNPVSRLRTAFALLVAGGKDHIDENLVDDSAGQLGIMSYVYALHLMHNGLESQLWTPQTLLDAILELRKADGGWAVTGQFSDVDVTAMCLQALAPHQKDREDVRTAIDEALTLLSQRQLDSGGFSSMGTENCESAAQVLLALQALGIDPESDSRFIKNGRDPLDALMEYRCASGGFAHLPGGTENQTAGVQALQALIALQLDEGVFYDFSTVELQPAVSHPSISAWKISAWAFIAAFTLLIGIFTLIRNHGQIKQLIFILVLALVAAAIVGVLDIQSEEDYYTHSPLNEPASGNVYMSIRCDTVAGRAQDGSTPEDGIILPRTQIPFAEGDSAFDVLTTAARLHRIQVEHEGGSGDMAYVTGINYLYEYDYGDLSGWVYAVNGTVLSEGCGNYRVKDGDEICWQYTLELGEDLK